MRAAPVNQGMGAHPVRQFLQLGGATIPEDWETLGTAWLIPAAVTPVELVR